MATEASAAAIIKRIYRPELVEKAVFELRPLLGLLPKWEKMGSGAVPVPIMYSNPQMRSHTFATAQGTSLNTAWIAPLVTANENHSLAHVSAKVAAGTRGDLQAFVRALKTEIDAAYENLADSVESELFRNQNGVLGVVATSGITTTALTLADINDVANFEINMELVGAATETGSLRDSGNSATVTAINRSTGVLTTDSNWTSQISGLTDADSLFQDGDAANGSGTPLAIAGLNSWMPSAAPSSGESFFGVDRSVSSRLWGTLHTGTGQMVEEALIDGQSKAAQHHEGRVDTYVINNAQYRKLAKELGSKKEYSESGALNGKGMVANVSYRGFKVQGDHGEVNIVAANKCQSTIAWGLQKSLWSLMSIGPVCRFDDTDGNELLRRASASGVEARLVSWSNLSCKAPGRNARVTLASA